VAREKHSLLQVMVHIHEHFHEGLGCEQVRVFLVQALHDSPVHDQARPIKLVSSKDVEASSLDERKNSISHLWYRWKLVKPFKVCKQRLSCFFNVELVALGELLDVSVAEAGRDGLLFLLQEVLLQVFHCLTFVFVDIVPAVVDFTPLLILL